MLKGLAPARTLHENRSIDQLQPPVPVDTGCDRSLISAQFVEKKGIPVETSTGPVSFRLMDSSATMRRLALNISQQMVGSMSHENFHVVKNTALGPVVLGNDFAALHRQGMTWDEHGQITVAAQGCVRGEGSLESVLGLIEKCSGLGLGRGKAIGQLERIVREEWWKGYSVVAIFIDIEDVLDKRSTWSALRGGVTPPWIFNAFMLTFERPISLWLTVIYADDGVMLFRYTDALSIQGSGVFGNDHKALV
ncbi:hypothetical protein FOZ60_012477 [Perkinsus olseni]|uniref:Uncharacterized protein n=1 Tax=Perkinsus olseni TaxID=32597 RepID=A0A7J6NCI8_PEROL|nr:hypothetical protein FOZ60_012477 [Perkinsus olseni]